ncbi:MAG: universal stress protein [Flavobacteriaceae bacterium]|nr:universal stress protein [Flavobacteriaceae bacterium]|tara:strand:+ start:23693 stop:24523 length:831 start_codon:yes stop_codon:yes gene_type:complete
MKRILVPIDFSRTSEYATKMAARIAKKSGAEIYLLHMIELPTGIVDMGAGANFSIPESMLYLRKLKERMLEYKEKFFDDPKKVHHSILFLHPYEGIVKYTKKINPDIIVMGSRGLSEFEGIVIGSNTEKVVRTSETPVVVVKKDETKFRIKNIVFASDFAKENEKDVLRKVQNFAASFGSRIHLLKVNTPTKFESTYEARQSIQEFIEDIELDKYSVNVYNDVSIEKGILHFAQEIDADLISLCTHGRSGIAHLFTSSVTKNLTKNALKPMLTIKV